jgi:hypothetical protein
MKKRKQQIDASLSVYPDRDPAETDRKQRDKGVVRFCPVCGRKPEYPPEQGGRHIYSLRCDKCQLGCIVHVNISYRA